MTLTPRVGSPALLPKFTAGGFWTGEGAFPVISMTHEVLLLKLSFSGQLSVVHNS